MKGVKQIDWYCFFSLTFQPESKDSLVKLKAEVFESQ